MVETAAMDEAVVETNRGTGDPGQQLGSKYFLAEPIGRGAMGVVHAATTRDNRPLAVKILRPELSNDDRTVARFVQERQIFNRIDHPNVVRVHDLVAEGDQLGIVMERVNGGDLKQRVDAQSLSPRQAMAVAAEVAAGLEAIHSVDVVHRDLKPANILIAERSDGSLRPKISDFGISRLVSDAMTKTSSTIGTPLYMAPEAADQRGAEAPADIYSLGALMFELLIGTAPFHEGGTFAVLKSHAMDVPPAIGGVPEQLALLIDHMLAKDPAARPDAVEVQRRLQAILPEIDDAVRPIAIERTAPSAQAAQSIQSSEGAAAAPADDGVGTAGVVAAGVAAAKFSDPSDSSETIVMDADAPAVNAFSETITDVALPAPIGGEAVPAPEPALEPEPQAEPGLFDAPQVSGDPVPGVHHLAPPAPLAPALLGAAGSVPAPPGSTSSAPPAPLPPTTGSSGSGFGGDRRVRRLAVIGVAAASIAAIAGVAIFALGGDGNEVAGGDDSTLIDAGTSEDANGDGEQTTASTAVADGSSGNGGRDGDGSSGQGTLTPTSITDGGSGGDSSEPTTATTDAVGTTTEGPAGPTTSAAEPSTTVTTSKSTTTSMPATTVTTKVTTTTSTTAPEPPVTIGPVDVPIEIVSGPTVNSTGSDKFHFNYTTNDVCGTGSFKVYKVDGGALVGSYTGGNICYGPTHGGFPQPSHPTFGGFNLEPGTAYRVVVTVKGTASDGARVAGSGSDSRSFEVTTDA